MKKSELYYQIQTEIKSILSEESAEDIKDKTSAQAELNKELEKTKELTTESLNPEVTRDVYRYIARMAKRYDYSEQDAVYAIMAALKQRKFDGLNEDLSMKIGKVVAIKKYNAAKNQKVPVDVKITDYIKKPGSKDFVEYELKGKKRKVSIDVFKSILAENNKILKEFTDHRFKGSEVIDDDEMDKKASKGAKKGDSVTTIANKLGETASEMKRVVNKWKKMEDGPEKEKLKDRLKALSKIKKELEGLL